MKRMPLATIVAASTVLATAAYADAEHKHDAPKAEAGASQSHDTHCCKPDPSDMKGMTGMHDMAVHQDEHAQAPKKQAAKKSVRKPARDTSQAAK
ncbi:MAG: hypothetical protein HY661_11695 [Betaproteobacteria bacterium]|nr:hypothetical protein [Betaproteobacteria bacterium]